MELLSTAGCFWRYHPPLAQHHTGDTHQNQPRMSLASVQETKTRPEPWGRTNPLPSKNLCQLSRHVLISFVPQCCLPTAAALGSLPAMGHCRHWIPLDSPVHSPGHCSNHGSVGAAGILCLWENVFRLKATSKKHMFNLNSYLLSL